MSRKLKVQYIVEGPLATAAHAMRCFGGKHAKRHAKECADALNEAHGSEAHSAVGGVGDRYGWSRTDPCPWDT